MSPPLKHGSPARPAAPERPSPAGPVVPRQRDPNRSGGIAHHRPTGWRSRRLWLLLPALGVLLLAGIPFVSGAPAEPGRAGDGPVASPSMSTAAATPAPTPSPLAPLPLGPLPLGPGPVTVAGYDFTSWALLDRRTGDLVGSDNMAATSTTASMLKAWLAADYLRRVADDGSAPSTARLRQLSAMIRDSDNAAATDLWGELGGPATVERLIGFCGLTDSQPGVDWSVTRLSARDTARMGACIADGRAAGPQWTKWLLDEMRQVRGAGDFGIRKAFDAAGQPRRASRIAIKNGWVIRDEGPEWHVNCLAIGDTWTMGVMLRYPTVVDGEYPDYRYGADLCEKITRQLIDAAERVTVPRTPDRRWASPAPAPPG